MKKSNTKSKIIITVLILAYPFLLQAQEIQLPVHKKGRLFLENGASCNFMKLSRFNDSLVCHTKYLNEIYAYEDIYKIEVRKNLIPELTCLFTGIGILVGWAYSSVWDEEVLGDKSTPYLITVPIFAVGGLITGAFLYKYKTIYVKDVSRFTLVPYYESIHAMGIKHTAIQIKLIIN